MSWTAGAGGRVWERLRGEVWVVRWFVSTCLAGLDNAILDCMLVGDVGGTGEAIDGTC